MNIFFKMRCTILVVFFVLVSSAYSTDDVCPQFQKPLPYKTPSPIPLDTCSAQRLNISSPLTLTISPFKILLWKNTGRIIEVTSNSNDAITVTGGILCNEVYILNRIRYYLNQNGTRSANEVDDISSPLEIVTIFYNKKYLTFENALLHPDGMVAISNSINVLGSVTNPLFTPLQLMLEYGVLRKPGSVVPLPNFLVFPWFDVANYIRNYFAYPASFTNLENKREFYCLTSIVVIPNIAYISAKQAFKNVLGLDGSPLQTVATLAEPDSRPVFLVNGDFQQIFKL